MRRLLACLALLVAALPAATAVATPTATPDPALRQQVSAQEKLVSGQVEIGRGHVDLGPLVRDGELVLAVRDDTAHPPVWRTLTDTVFRVSDAALLEIPDGPQYAFLGLEPGAKVHVVPQTQAPEVVWLGWNTQHPSIASLAGRGVTLRYQSLDGPGGLHVFLQNGFDAPQQLWTSAKDTEQDLWVDLHTHTHANWVFTAPGVHRVQIQARAKGLDGAEHVATGVLTFAVGSAVSADEARRAAATSAHSASPSPPVEATETPVAAAEPSDDSPSRWVWIVGGAAAAGLVAAGAVVLARRRRRADVERRRILAGGDDD